MILRSIHVENFRRFRHPVTLTGLPTGLVVLSGENEEGKSTLMAAVRAVFFAKHSWSGSHVDSFKPHGSDVAPMVTVDFEIGDQKCQIQKRFCSRKFCRLQLDDQVWEGDAAEETLARLLGAEVPQRPPRNGEDTGLEGPLGMLWVRQGEAWSARTGETAAKGVRGLLEGEVGEILGGQRAESILAETSKRRQELITDTGKPTRLLKVSQERQFLLQSQVADLSAKTAAQEKQRTEFADKLRRRMELDAQLPEVRAFRERAQADADEAQRLQKFLDQMIAKRDTADERRRRLEGQQSLRAAKRKAIALLAIESTQRISAVTQAEDDRRAAADATNRVMAEAQRLSEALTLAESLRASFETRIELDSQRLQLMDAEARLAAARDAEVKHASLLAVCRGLIDKRSLNALRTIWDNVIRSEAVLDGAATAIEASLAPGVTATLDGRSCEWPTWSADLDRPAGVVISMNGIEMATMTFVPRGTEEKLRELESARETWQKTAKPWSVANLSEAEIQNERRSDAEGQAALAMKDVERHAPDGVAQLAVEVDALGLRVAQLEPRASTVAAGELKSAAADARMKEGELREQIAANSALRVGAQKDFERADQILRQAANASQQSANELKAKSDELNRELAENPDDRLAAEAEEAGRAFASASANIDPIEAQAREANRTQGDLARATQAQQILDQDIGNLVREIDQARGELSAAQPWAEELLRVEGELAFQNRRLEELQHRAAALKILEDTLKQSRSAAQSHFLGPVLQRVEPLLARLLPGARITLDTGLEPAHIERGLGSSLASEEFETLSLGTKEQIAILVRLAFAQLLRERGKPAVTILDDAPAYADHTRFAEMLRILDDSARDNQVLVLTCRERDFRLSGAHVVRLGTKPDAATAAAAFS